MAAMLKPDLKPGRSGIYVRSRQVNRLCGTCDCLHVIRGSSAFRISDQDRRWALPLKTSTFQFKKMNSLEDLAKRGEYILRLSTSPNNCVPELPAAITHFPSLQGLTLSSWHGITRLPADFGSLRYLWLLEILDCKELVSLGEGFSDLLSLRNLCLSNCDKLESLPSLPPTLKVLNCSNVGFAELPADIGRLQQLTKLHLAQCKRLTALPNSLCQLSRLVDLQIIYCNGVQTIPPYMGLLHSLQSLHVYPDEHLESHFEACLNVVETNLHDGVWYDRLWETEGNGLRNRNRRLRKYKPALVMFIAWSNRQRAGINRIPAELWMLIVRGFLRQ